MRPQDERDLRTVLHEEADRHQPDRVAMLARINHARSTPAPRALARLIRSTVVAALPRPVAAAACVAAVLVLAVAGVQLANRSPQPSNPAAATASATASPTPTAAPPPRTGSAPSPTGHPSSGRGTSSLGPATAVTSPAPSAAGDGYLGATAVLDPHSTPTWSQGTVTLTTTATITALTVVVRIARTNAEADTGHWSSVPAELATSTVAVQNTVIVYRFTLNDGATLAPGSYVFAVQYSHAAGRVPTADTYEVTAYAARSTSSASPTAVAPTGSARKAQVSGVFQG